MVRIKTQSYQKVMTNRTRVIDVADEIAFRIVSGKYAVGENLPGIRKLATEFSINPSTVQIVLAKLESIGFVKSRPSAGFSVIDVETDGGIATWKYIFRFAQQIPDRAVRLYRDLLDFRSLIIVDALKRIAKEPQRFSVATVRREVERLELVMKTSSDDCLEIARAQINTLRALYIATEQAVLTSVINSISEVYLEVPAVMQTMTDKPEVHVEMWKFLILEWEQGTLSEETIQVNIQLLKSFDDILLKHFEQIVTSPGYKPDIYSLTL
ncbi:MAG: hypothetical protein COA99_14530 [Moraxellaceae bacterium]|nr:MAG: hypothetical protein COA99_14530 [Moraxellaceae bacterium]